MNPAILVILQYAVQYGIPAALEIVKLFQKPNPTLADWEAAFAVAQTPYGLTPNLALLGADPISVGNLQPPVPVSTDAVPPEFDTPGRPRVAAKKVAVQGSGRVVCNAAGDCWVFPDAARIPIATVPTGQIWGTGAVAWFIPTAFLA